LEFDPCSSSYFSYSLKRESCFDPRNLLHPLPSHESSCCLRFQRISSSIGSHFTSCLTSKGLTSQRIGIKVWTLSPKDKHTVQFRHFFNSTTTSFLWGIVLFMPHLSLDVTDLRVLVKTCLGIVNDSSWF
jgi:hypothetical protein